MRRATRVRRDSREAATRRRLSRRRAKSRGRDATVFDRSNGTARERILFIDASPVVRPRRTAEGARRGAKGLREWEWNRDRDGEWNPKPTPPRGPPFLHTHASGPFIHRLAHSFSAFARPTLLHPQAVRFNRDTESYSSRLFFFLSTMNI